MIDFLKKYWYKYKLEKGLSLFETTGVTSTAAYSALRKMFILTGGKSNDKISLAISKKNGKYNLDNVEGVLGKLSNDDIKNMVNAMNKDGYYIFDQKLPQAQVDELYNYAINIPCKYLDVEKGQYSTEEVLFNPGSPIAPRYDFSPQSIINRPVIQQLLFDQSLLAFAQQYLGAKPILDLIAFWWSLPFHGKGKEAAAQMYHFDMDRIKFLKFFFYLTDVDTNNGPHCFVKGSHINLPKNLSRDGRFTDEEIEANYGTENLIEICGEKGAIIAVDTRGFHKGKELIRGSRLIFQIEFANSMFGQAYPPSHIDFVNDDIKSNFNKYPYTYNQIMVE